MSDKLIVKADVDETDIGRVRMGMPASITLDSYPNQPIDGTVFHLTAKFYSARRFSNLIGGHWQ